MKRIELSKHIVSPTNSYLFDTNVWLYINGPIAGSRPDKQKKYVNLLHDIKSRKSGLYVTSLMITMKFIIYVLVSLVLLNSCDKGSNDDNIMPCAPIDTIDTTKIVDPTDTVNFNHLDSTKMAEFCSKSPNYGKTVGVFGGSYSVIPESNVVKDLWRKFLKMDVKDYGIPGHGYSSLQGSIQNQVDMCDLKDIYVLWSSNNDFLNNRKVGFVSDYSLLDNFNKGNLGTQCGGINYCIKKLKEKNPKCKIYLFTTMQNFYKDCDYDTTKVNGIGANLNQYVTSQIACCKRSNIPYINLLEKNYFNINNYLPYYRNDHLHLNEKGYGVISLDILQFIADIKQKYTNK